MQISPVKEESALLYAEADESVSTFSPSVQYSYGGLVEPVMPNPIMNILGIVQFSTFCVSLLAIILLLANRFELLGKTKKKGLDEKEKIRYGKNRKIFLSLLVISNIIFFCSICVYDEVVENSETIVYFVILLCYIFAIIKNIIKIKKCEIEKKAKYLNRLEIISILLIPVTLIVAFLYELVI